MFVQCAKDQKIVKLNLSDLVVIKVAVRTLVTMEVVVGATSQRLHCGCCSPSAGRQEQQTEGPTSLIELLGGLAEAEPGKQPSGKAGPL